MRAEDRQRIIEQARNEWAHGPQNIEERMAISAAIAMARIIQERYSVEHQHGCKSYICAQCSHTEAFHRDVFSVLDDPHKFEPIECTCGLADLLVLGDRV